jgi:hypothetical protein
MCMPVCTHLQLVVFVDRPDGFDCRECEGECCCDVGGLATLDLSEAGEDLLRQQARSLHLHSSCRVIGCTCDQWLQTGQ